MNYRQYTFGEEHPFLKATKTGYQRLGEALVHTNSQLLQTRVHDGYLYATVAVSIGLEEQFEEMCRVKLTDVVTISGSVVLP